MPSRRLKIKTTSKKAIRQYHLESSRTLLTSDVGSNQLLLFIDANAEKLPITTYSIEGHPLIHFGAFLMDESL